MARLHVRTILIPGRSEKSLAEHTAILEALKAGDGDAAEVALRKHMKSLREAIRKPRNVVGV
jgi:DNA-binding GntR family transcriptional regulator